MFSKSIMILILGTLIKWIIANMEAKSKGKTGTFKLNIYSAVSFVCLKIIMSSVCCHV